MADINQRLRDGARSSSLLSASIMLQRSTPRPTQVTINVEIKGTHTSGAAVHRCPLRRYVSGTLDGAVHRLAGIRKRYLRRDSMRGTISLKTLWPPCR